MSAGQAAVEWSEPVWNVSQGLDHMRSEGRDEHPSHDLVTRWLAHRYRETFSLLDGGVMSAVTYEKLQLAGLAVDYTGIDRSATVLADCCQRFPRARWEHGNILDLAYGAATFDVVYARHLLEHVPYYETAVREMFRVARDSIVICLFQVPAEPERLLRRETPNGYIWLNRYAPGPLEALLRSLSVSVESHDVSLARRINRVYFCEKAPAGR
jgi:ubiquinone/menaquinone biosynthesis C-methylase UbiE